MWHNYHTHKSGIMALALHGGKQPMQLCVKLLLHVIQTMIGKTFSKRLDSHEPGYNVGKSKRGQPLSLRINQMTFRTDFDEAVIVGIEGQISAIAIFSWYAEAIDYVYNEVTLYHTETTCNMMFEYHGQTVRADAFITRKHAREWFKRLAGY